MTRGDSNSRGWREIGAVAWPKSTPARPSRWQPASVQNPDDGNNEFTDDGAWNLVVSKIESGHQVAIMTLDKPKGATGYVMKIRLDTSRPQLYVKLELYRGWILGRSFHYSDR